MKLIVSTNFIAALYNDTTSPVAVGRLVMFMSNSFPPTSRYRINGSHLFYGYCKMALRVAFQIVLVNNQRKLDRRTCIYHLNVSNRKEEILWKIPHLFRNKDIKI